MPLPKPNKGEETKDFLSRCMGDEKMNKEFSDQSQRYAVCQNQVKASLIEETKDLAAEIQFV